MVKEMYIVCGTRTPFTKFSTDLSDESSLNLGVSVTRSILNTSGVDVNLIDEVVFGCCIQPLDTIGNVARAISVRSGIPISVPAVSVHRNCASGFEAITYACDKAANGKGDVFIVGGVESMSNSPLYFSKAAASKFTNLSKSKTFLSKLQKLAAFRPSDFTPQIALKTGLHDSLCDLNMGQTAELLARQYNISRQEQDRFAQESHIKAARAQSTGVFLTETSSVFTTHNNCIRSHNGKDVLCDNGIRKDITMAALSRLKPIFDRAGTVTPGNSSQITDGGAALLLMTKKGLRRTNSTPIARIVGYEYIGCDPSRMGLGPVHAISKLQSSYADLALDNIDLFEINEAFAAQVIAVLAEMTYKIPLERLNVNGGAIALGHPLAASGIRLVLSLTTELIRRDKKNGIASLCVGGGQGGALWIETV